MSGKRKAPMFDIPIFDLDLEDLASSYGKLMAQILKRIRKQIRQEIKRQPPLYRMPDDIRGKTYTPQGGVFLVRMTLNGVVVYLLYQWINLYFMGFNAKGIWYLFDGFDKKNLPLPAQVFYIVKHDRGIKHLNMQPSYKNIGGSEIWVGKDTFFRCHRSLDAAAELLQTAQGLNTLLSGPLALPAVGISEALRFLRFKGWMQSAISLDSSYLVPKRYSENFTYYSQLCEAYIRGQSFGKISLPMLEAMLGVLIRSEIEPVALKWGGSASTSKSELVQMKMEEQRNKRLSVILHAPGTKYIEESAPSTPAEKDSKDNEQLHLLGDETQEGNKAAEKHIACKDSTNKNEGVKSPIMVNVKPCSDTMHMEKALEEHLTGKNYISGSEISKDDIKVFAAVPSKPGSEFPNAACWYDTIAAATASRFPGKAAGVSASSALAVAAPITESAMDTKDNEQLHLLGDETEEANKAVEKQAACKASTDKNEGVKSRLMVNVKPWSDTIHMEKALEEHLTGKNYIFGSEISKEDIKVFTAVPSNPAAEFPNAACWYDTVSAATASRVLGKAAGVSASSAPAPAAESAMDADDDGDLDLFGNETEDKLAECEAAKRANKKESGKSSVLINIKPWDGKTDMKKLEEVVRSIQMEGLTWGASELVPVGYGISKLQIMMMVVDDLVSVDCLIKEVLCEEPHNKYIQSCDIVSFDKI